MSVLIDDEPPKRAKKKGKVGTLVPLSSFVRHAAAAGMILM